VRTVIPKGESKLWVDGGTAEVTHFGSSIVSSFLVLRQLSFAMIRTHGQRRCRARALPLEYSYRRLQSLNAAFGCLFENTEMMAAPVAAEKNVLLHYGTVASFPR
jgi:hypothetical protein